MCKMANASSPIWPARTLALLFLLVICLAIHFLFDDLTFLVGSPSISTMAVNVDELTHQDDLAISVTRLAEIPAMTPLTDFCVIFASQEQAVFPILHPPKI
jgi:hypothetical protein